MTSIDQPASLKTTATATEATEDVVADVAAVGRIDAVGPILEVICRSTGLRFAAVARVTKTRWIACAVRDEIEFGLKAGGELKIETTICDEIRDNQQRVVIDHVSEDAHFCRHPTPRMYGFQSYISIPIMRKDGTFFGTLCALDPLPAKLSDAKTIQMFELFAQLISMHLDAEDRLRQTQAALLDEQQTSELRDQFIAVLGHDLRNPLFSVTAGTEMLLRTPLTPTAETIVRRIQRSGSRMLDLVNNVLDFARGRLGGGIIIENRVEQDLRPALEHVVAELSAIHPDRRIVSKLDFEGFIACDVGRISQLLSNLLGNALTYGSVEAPVEVHAVRENGMLRLSVSNKGRPIPPETQARLFQPFSRFETNGENAGLGLGLYIGAQIASAHGGSLEVESSVDATTFIFRMPA